MLKQNRNKHCVSMKMDQIIVSSVIKLGGVHIIWCQHAYIDEKWPNCKNLYTDTRRPPHRGPYMFLLLFFISARDVT